MKETQVPKNKLYTKSYAAKRLRDEGFTTFAIDIKYDRDDCRYWTLIINPNSHNIFMTCYLNKEDKTDFYFKLHSSRNTISIKTQSMVILSDGIRNLIQEIEKISTDKTDSN